ncbi:MAG: hypothetical protein SNJ29_07240 [Rikenellaceae bacterium]
MALVHATIKSEVAAAFEAVMTQADDDRSGAIDTVADKIATAIENAIKSMEITYSTGLVAPAGTAGGPVTGTFTYTIS